MPGRRVYVRTLEHALRIIGNEAALAELLWVSVPTLRRYLGGDLKPPDDVFLKAADIVFNDAWRTLAARPAPLPRKPHAERIERTRGMVRAAVKNVSASQAVLEATQALRVEAAALREASQACGLNHRLFDPDYQPKDQRDVLQTGLDAALQASATDLGDIELADASGGLHIAAARGFPAALLGGLDAVSEQGSACRLAFAEHAQVVICDVTSHPLYVGTPALETLRAADVRAICATPIMDGGGVVLGIVATHFHEPKAPRATELTALQLVARGTAAWLGAIAVS
jgi:GAF domain